MVPIDEELSAELQHNSRITAKYLCPVDWLAERSQFELSGDFAGQFETVRQ